MRGGFRVPMVVVAVALLGLIALLATLQYRWLGRISDAERERMIATLNTRAGSFADDFDAELTRAFVLFQLDPPHDGDNLPARVATRYDRWQTTSRYPRMIKDVYLVSDVSETAMHLQRFNAGTRVLEPVEWPAAFQPLRKAVAAPREMPRPAGGFVVRTMVPTVWEDLPALVIPAPLFFVDQHNGNAGFKMLPSVSYTVLALDRDYLTGEMLPALAQQHFRGTGDGFDYQVAVVSSGARNVVYHSAGSFSPKPEDKVDAAVDLFQVRTQDFASIAAEVRRFATTTFTASAPRPGAAGAAALGATIREQLLVPSPGSAPVAGKFTMRDGPPLSIIVQQGATPSGRGMLATGTSTTSTRLMTSASPRWRLMIKHPSGSLEAAVNSARRRNLLVSSSILAVLGASVGLLILSTRRAQELARQQMEFVAAVSHELRTPLAVIRSAGENLADGVVRDDAQIRKYGDLVKNEGRRLTEMVEQILEFAGIQSGQRGFALRPVAISGLLRDVVDSSAALIEAGRFTVEYDIPESLPPVLGDEPALRRVLQNLIGNAIKYGVRGGWIGLRARVTGREVHITVADRGIGVAAAEQARIFEPFYRSPDVVAAQIQGAGLGLSLVKRIVEAHGGRITVQSSPATGTEFTVTLPAASEEPVGRASLAEAHGHGSHA